MCRFFSNGCSRCAIHGIMPHFIYLLLLLIFLIHLKSADKKPVYVCSLMTITAHLAKLVTGFDQQVHNAPLCVLIGVIMHSILPYGHLWFQAFPHFNVTISPSRLHSWRGLSHLWCHGACLITSTLARSLRPRLYLCGSWQTPHPSPPSSRDMPRSIHSWTCGSRRRKQI